MFSPTASDSAALSPDTADVLIRSTRVFLPGDRQEAGEDPPPVQTRVQQRREPLRVMSTRAKNLQRAADKPGAGDPAGAGGEQGQELQTSCFKAGGRGVVLGALRQRCHSTQRKREVSVQLLEPRPTPNTLNCLNSPDLIADDAAGASGVQTEPSCGGMEDVSKTATAAAAAAVAAAVATTAPLIKAQSHMEARVGQLSEGIQELLRTNRDADSQGRSRSQQTLHHLETLQKQQLQLQSQLLESAIMILTGHDSMTSDSKAKVKEQMPSSSGAGGPAIPPSVMLTDAVAVETCQCDSRPRATRDDLHLQDPLTDPVAESIHLRSLAHDTQEAAKRASDMLKQMERLKTEITMLLSQREDTSGFTLPPPGCLQIQDNQPESQHSKAKPKEVQFELKESQRDRSKSHESQARPNDLQQNDSQITDAQYPASNMGPQHQSQHNQPHSLHLRPIQTPTQAGPLITNHGLTQEAPAQSAQRLHAHPSQFHSSLLQRKPGGSSMLEDAGRVLRQARRRKKVLENNLEALRKAKNGEILHCQLEALAANRDLTEEVRIKKTVDAWISALARGVQSSSQQTPGRPNPPQGEILSVDAIQSRAADVTRPRPRTSGRGKPMSVNKGMSNKSVVGSGSRGQIAGHRMQQEEAVRVSGSLKESQQNNMEGELYLTRLYGKLPYEGVRRTLKKSPYPRFSSPVSPVGRKQHPRLVESIRGVRLKSCKTQTSFSPAEQRSQYHVFGSSYQSLQPAQPTVTCAESSTAARAVPLRLPRMASSSRCERSQERTSVLPTPRSASDINMNNGAHNQQEQQAVTLKSPSSPPPIIKIIAAEHLKDQEDEETSFPGNNFVSVTDIQQEESSEVPDEAVVLEGAPSPVPVQFHSPDFPAGAPSTRWAEDGTPVLERSQRQDILANRLVEWVEQQLMSRMIADMYYPPPPDPVQNNSVDDTELEERSRTSDIVEAAGGGGLQLFVDSGVSVDSALIRQLVNEVLTETVAQMLCQTNAVGTAPEKGPEMAKSKPSGDKEEEPPPLVRTPAPTPVPSVPQLSRESTPAETPPPSKPSSPVPQDSPEPVTAPDPVATPAATPEPHRPEESPSAAHPAPPMSGEPEEERLEEQLEPQKQPVYTQTSVAEEELPVPAQPQPSLPEPGPEVPPSLSVAHSSSSSSSSSSSTVTAETEAALKHISEGELLISVNQLALLTEEEGVSSFSSSLHEVEDVAFDSSVVEQVAGRNLLLTMLTKMEQGVTHRGRRPQPEDSWGRDEVEDDMSVGEVRDDGQTKPPNQTEDPAGWGQISRPAEYERQDTEDMKTGAPVPSFRARGDRNEDVNKETEKPMNADTDSSSSDVF